VTDEPSVPGLALSPAPTLASALADRLRGPGGVYNLGNTLGLAGGLWLAVGASAAAHGPSLDGAAQAIAGYLAGSGSAAALTAATLIFFWSGEVYHRAWATTPAPDPGLNRQGDLLSALGALVLGLALAMLGHPVLAATAGFLHALGKLGSALHGPTVPGWPATWPDPFRSLVLLSRLPAMGLALLAIWSGWPLGQVAEPALLFACSAIWARADLLLFRA
jgi:hypothetical protein